MKKILLSLAAVAALAAAAPSMAQPFDHAPSRGMPIMSIDQRISNLDSRIDRGMRSGAISRREAFSLRTDLRSVRTLAWRYGRDGLNFRERADLTDRLDRLSMRVSREARDDNRGPGGDRYPGGDRHDYHSDR